MPEIFTTICHCFPILVKIGQKITDAYMNNPKLEDHPFLAVCDSIYSRLPSVCRLHPQPEVAPCRGNREPLVTAVTAVVKQTKEEEYTVHTNSVTAYLPDSL
jgi:hypothetical protein